MSLLKGKKLMIAGAVATGLIVLASAASGDSRMRGNPACEVKGKIKIVDYGEDYKVKKVTYGEDVEVKWVDYGADSQGEWQEVTYGEDVKIKFVDYGEDFSIEEVTYGEGC